MLIFLTSEIKYAYKLYACKKKRVKKSWSNIT